MQGSKFTLNPYSGNEDDPDFELMAEICAEHKHMGLMPASDWAEKLRDGALQDRLQDSRGNPKKNRAQSTIVGSLFNQYLDTEFDCGDGLYVLKVETDGYSRKNRYGFVHAQN